MAVELLRRLFLSSSFARSLSRSILTEALPIPGTRGSLCRFLIFFSYFENLKSFPLEARLATDEARASVQEPIFRSPRKIDRMRTVLGSTDLMTDWLLR